MKNKIIDSLMVAALVLTLGGCRSHQTSTSKPDTPKTEKTTHKKATTTSQTGSGSQATTTSSATDETNQISSTATNDNGQSETNQAASTATNETTQANKSSQAQADSASSVQSQTFDNQSQAASYVNNQGYTDGKAQQGLPVVDLGNNITGTINSGAGQQQLQWNEGNWSFTVCSSAVSGQDPVPTAKQVVARLEETYLPAPQDRGVGTFNIATGTYTLTWQKNNKVYTVSGSSPDDVIDQAVNIGK